MTAIIMIIACILALCVLAYAEDRTLGG